MGFPEAYDAVEFEYQLASEMLKARSRTGLTQDEWQSVWVRPRAPPHRWNLVANMRPRCQRLSARV